MMDESRKPWGRLTSSSLLPWQVRGGGAAGGGGGGKSGLKVAELGPTGLIQVLQLPGCNAVTLAKLGGWGLGRSKGQEGARGSGRPGSRDGCAVCSHSMEHGDVVRQLPCGHQMHDGCANTWLYVRAECPTCGVALARGK